MSASQSYPQFAYSAQLKPGELRLLRLVDGPGDELHFNLEFANLADDREDREDPARARYMALSYVWGSEENKREMLVDGQKAFVTHNLHAALSNPVLRLKCQSLPIWVDAVCIDQGNEDEKMAQIARMADVYSQACEVLVFLGAGSENTDLAMQDMDRIGKEALARNIDSLRDVEMSFWPDFHGVEDGEAKARALRSLKELMAQEAGGLPSSPAISLAAIRDLTNSQEGEADEWVQQKLEQMGHELGDFSSPPGISTAAIFDLLDAPWFTRAWVVQELVMAPRGAVSFVCGSKQVSWENMSASYFFLAVWKLLEIPSLASPDATRKEQLMAQYRFRLRFGMWLRADNGRTSRTLGMRSRFLGNRLSRSMKSLMIASYVTPDAAPLECRDAKDKILALACMAPDSQRLDVINLAKMRPHIVHIPILRGF